LEANHPYFDRKDSRENPKGLLVHVSFKHKFKEIISLQVLQSFARPGGILASMQILKKPHMSVTNVTADEWNFIMRLADIEAETETGSAASNVISGNLDVEAQDKKKKRAVKASTASIEEKADGTAPIASNADEQRVGDMTKYKKGKGPEKSSKVYNEETNIKAEHDTSNVNLDGVNFEAAAEKGKEPEKKSMLSIEGEIGESAPAASKAGEKRVNVKAKGMKGKTTGKSANLSVEESIETNDTVPEMKFSEKASRVTTRGAATRAAIGHNARSTSHPLDPASGSKRKSTRLGRASSMDSTAGINPTSRVEESRIANISAPAVDKQAVQSLDVRPAKAASADAEDNK
jgi:uncharacterized ParB-like nuclease family protein